MCFFSFFWNSYNIKIDFFFITKVTAKSVIVVGTSLTPNPPGGSGPQVSFDIEERVLARLHIRSIDYLFLPPKVFWHLRAVHLVLEPVILLNSDKVVLSICSQPGCSQVSVCLYLPDLNLVSVRLWKQSFRLARQKGKEKLPTSKYVKDSALHKAAFRFYASRQVYLGRET